MKFSELSAFQVGAAVVVALVFILLLALIIALSSCANKNKQGFKAEYAITGDPVSRVLLNQPIEGATGSKGFYDTLEGVATTNAARSSKYHAQKKSKAVREGFDSANHTTFEFMRSGEQSKYPTDLGKASAEVINMTNFAEMGSGEHLRWMGNYSVTHQSSFGDLAKHSGDRVIPDTMAGY